MYVPGFAGASPEAKAAKNLNNFFNYIASYNREAYEEITEFLGSHSLNDGDKFISELMRESSQHKGLALRILEVRSAYCKNDFEWDNLKRLAIKMVNESNTRLMRDYVLETSPVEAEK
ncbi:chaperonin-like RBCX protein 1, chloroplastic isoform X2 [Mangifera indica]|uniref:chaperonin-like RBCX protein 1, chloroplastic isoform X2 n=1 Tax=Mangifera indica TaxID=29780 RepID=UPI001CF98F6F|nr:chaperonin-like RBCX protein 1, chloroplastic isoform X2 [Mangifera indica]